METSIQTTDSKTVLSEQDATALRDLLATHSMSKSTQRAYKAGLAEFNQWLSSNGYQADEAGISSYLLALDRAGAKTATIKQKLAAIRFVHDAGKTKAVSSTMAAIIRKRADATQDSSIDGVRGNASRSKRQVSIEQLSDMVRSSTRPTLVEVRNRALLLVGFWLAARRSELVALNVEDIEWTQGGAFVHIGRSKTDQSGQGHVKPLVSLANGEKIIDPCAALREWLRVSGIKSGAVFVGITAHDKIARPQKRITAQVVALVVKSYCRRVGADESAFSGHSLRSGFVTAARKLDIPDATIKAVTLHKTDAMLDHYDKRDARDALRIIREKINAKPLADKTVDNDDVDISGNVI